MQKQATATTAPANGGVTDDVQCDAEWETHGGVALYIVCAVLVALVELGVVAYFFNSGTPSPYKDVRLPTPTPTSPRTTATPPRSTGAH